MRTSGCTRIPDANVRMSDLVRFDIPSTMAYEKTSTDEKSVVYSHSNEIPDTFAVDVKERQDRLPTMYWLPKLHKIPYKARFITNSSSCTTTELSKLLCLHPARVGRHIVFPLRLSVCLSVIPSQNRVRCIT